MSLLGFPLNIVTSQGHLVLRFLIHDSKFTFIVKSTGLQWEFLLQ